MSLDLTLAERLEQRRRQGLYRQRSTLASAQGPEVMVDGQRLLNFCSNDYLGLASHPEVMAAMTLAVQNYGTGSGASHLVCGHSREHHLLEEELAQATGRERALLFSTGYMANLGTISALVGKGDAIFEDRLNHASLLDGGLLSGARFQRFRHADLQDLQQRLQSSDATHKLIVLDGVFSMDGDLSPLPGLAELARTYDAWLMVDDAHGFGCLGRRGAGSVEHFGLDPLQVPILMGTLGKALGSFGAFVAGSEALIEYLIQAARPYIYTTALPPAVAAATRTALRLMQAEDWRRQHLQRLIQRFRSGARDLGLQLMASDTAIQPVLVGDVDRAMQASAQLRQRGFWVAAIRPPTVPRGTSRLRITLSAAHSNAQVDELLAALGAILS